MKVGFITIGQSPREDMNYIWKDIKGIVDIIEVGILDNYSKEYIENNFSSKDGKDLLVTRLRDNQVVKISKDSALDLVQKTVYELEEKGCEIIVLLCTADFTGIKTKAVFIESNKVIVNAVKTISDNKNIAIVIPDIKQKEELMKRWVKIGILPEVFVINPYGKEDEINLVAFDIKEKNLDIIILDCMGYDEKLQSKLKENTKAKVILPRKLVKGFIESII